ncbi:MAG TPA: cytochrome c oxidase subunit II [Polyangiaceae bacterium]|nr:cytochrome c oxidase subunit II [Polyangiaceae bacterium]
MTRLSSLLLTVGEQPKNLPKVPESDTFWMPLDASVTTRSVDWIYYFLYWMSVISCVLVFGAMILFIVKYRARSRSANQKVERTSDHSTALEVTWSVLPLFVVIALFVWGFRGFVDLRTVPKNAIEIRATGQKWKWLFTYPNGYVDDQLHVPQDRPVRMLINSVDVLHSLYIPNFRTKMDAVPGRYTDLWFQANQPGEFPVFCAEYCGTSHSNMLTQVVVHEPGGYEKWLNDASVWKGTPEELGANLYAKQGCNTCHSVDGSPLIGPTWKGLFGKTENTSAGAVKVDENYLRESIVDPTAKVVTGFTPSMPTYQGKLKDAELDGIIAYIKSLK